MYSLILTMRRFILCILLSLGGIPLMQGRTTLDSLLTVLDKTISKVAEYDSAKEQEILSLKSMLNTSAPGPDRHTIYFQLFKEYEPYVFDSAMYYVKQHLEYSLMQHDISWVNECKMQLARMYSTYVRFNDAIDLLNSINKTGFSDIQLGSYYSAMGEIYTYWEEYASSDMEERYRALKETYQDSAILIVPKNTYAYDINYGRRCIDMRQFDKAERALLPYLPQVEKDTRDYAILTSIIAYLYELKGDEEKQLEFLALSAIADIKASIKENTSLGLLASALMQKGDITRANRYIKKSMDDANFYNARLRNIQVSKILPIIDSAYQLEKDKHQKYQRTALIVILILSLFLVSVIVYLIRQMRKLARTRKEIIIANRELRQLNKYLKETNHIKEEYIGRFMNQCSVYIDKLENFRKALNKKASAKKLDELYDMLKSSQLIEDELKEFYETFDTSFLYLFPDFVNQFNNLLPEEDRVKPKQENSLTVELRIFALIRLGITDSAKIASFLRYSITTIYNYRSKYRNKALIGRERFEETVGTLH